MNVHQHNFMRIAAFFGLLAVALGAFGAHGLKPHLDAYRIGIFEKGVQYQFYHAAALAIVALSPAAGRSAALFRWSGILFTAGVCAFSGSLYLLACRDLLPFPTAWAGPVTPLGGLCFIGGWLCLLLAWRR